MTPLKSHPEFEALLHYLRLCRGFDFTGYKRSSLMRRVNKRMQMLSVESYSDYQDYLEVHPDEFIELFNTLLINVTSFFRDRPAWDYIINEIIPQMAARKQQDKPLRIWCAGCASGEEAYTLAIAVAEVLGVKQLREQVKIYATDIDTEALAEARSASYNAKQLANLPPEWVEKYFERSEDRYVFHKDLRRSVIFGRHDLIQDAPISRIDLLTCRNAIMYFNSETQAKILTRFHFALKDGGFLFLGKAELLLTHANTFAAVDLKHRIFTKISNVNLRDRLSIMPQSSNEESVNDLASSTRIREATFDVNPVAQIVLNINNVLILANELSRTLFGLLPQDIGRPLQDLELSYRPAELRSSIDKVYAERRPIHLKDIEWRSGSGIVYIEVKISPLTSVNGNVLGVSITFLDVTRYKKLQEELEHSNQELEMAYEELQSTNEELETTNEELQSTVEELETTNEELQSTNEELETMNEELQSTNEELQSMNDIMRQRSEELNEVNGFLESILTSLRGGVAVIDKNLQVLVWNDKAEDLWGWRSDEVQGQQFLSLDIGLSVEQLIQPIRSCLVGDLTWHELILPAINRRGKAIECKVTCTPLKGINNELRGVILVMEEQDAVTSDQ